MSRQLLGAKQPRRPMPGEAVFDPQRSSQRPQQTLGHFI
jgi:hypothetical protein